MRSANVSFGRTVRLFFCKNLKKIKKLKKYSELDNSNISLIVVDRKAEGAETYATHKDLLCGNIFFNIFCLQMQAVKSQIRWSCDYNNVKI